MFDVPNLDDMSINPEDYETLRDVFTKLANYCRCKNQAMRSRLEGDINIAGIYEATMQSIYDKLPQWAKW